MVKFSIYLNRRVFVMNVGYFVLIQRQTSVANSMLSARFALLSLKEKQKHIIFSKRTRDAAASAVLYMKLHDFHILESCGLAV